MTFDVILVIGILVFFALLEIVLGQLKQSNRNKSDWFQEAGGFLVLSLIIKPVLFKAIKKGKASLCNCKATKTPIYCNGSHRHLNK